MLKLGDYCYYGRLARYEFNPPLKQGSYTDNGGAHALTIPRKDVSDKDRNLKGKFRIWSISSLLQNNLYRDYNKYLITSLDEMLAIIRCELPRAITDEHKQFLKDALIWISNI